MNLNPLGVVMFVAGVVLMYSAVRARDPRNVVLETFGRKAVYPDFGVGKAGGFADRSGMGTNPSLPPPQVGSGRIVSV